ncbi:MAG: TetR/AcrR family transcriptional regulator [Erysipelotrichaceae bacterium]|jgi:phage-related tail protein
MERKQNNRPSSTKKNLMDAYWSLYELNNPDKITVRMITDKAGYNRGTFYAYFLDIEDLHNQIEEELLPTEENFDKLREATFSKNSRKIIDILIQKNKASGKRISLLLSSKGTLSFQTKFKQRLQKLIMKYAPLDLKDSEKVISYKVDIVCNIFYATLCYWYNKGHQFFSDEEMINLMLKVIFFGLTDENMKQE